MSSIAANTARFIWASNFRRTKMKGTKLFTQISITIETAVELDIMLTALELYSESRQAAASQHGKTDDNAEMADRMRLVIAETAGL